MDPSQKPRLINTSTGEQVKHSRLFSQHDRAPVVIVEDERAGAQSRRRVGCRHQRRNRG